MPIYRLHTNVHNEAILPADRPVPEAVSTPAANLAGASNAEQALAFIKERVLDGSFAPGARLTEEGLARELGTSRTPVREAMRLLIADGFLRFVPNTGTFVRTWDAHEIREIFELRATLESEVAASAATRIGAADIERLAALQDALDACGPPQDEPAMTRVGALNREFHGLFAAASARPRLIATLANAIEMPIVHQTLRRYSPAQVRRSFAHHRELVDAFRARDAEWARAVMLCHVRAASHAMLGPDAAPA